LRNELNSLRAEPRSTSFPIGPISPISPISFPEPASSFDPPVDPLKVITIVSGLPRSGTSLMMQLLAAAGREVLTDSKRTADEDNPRGYFEFEKTLTLPADASWLTQARGKVVKIVAQLLPFLPPGEHYQILFMERNAHEILASQKAMLARHNLRGADLDDASLLETFAAQLQRVRQHLAQFPQTRVLTVEYARLVDHPLMEVSRISDFLGQPFNESAATQSICPELQRRKLAELEPAK